MVPRGAGHREHVVEAHRQVGQHDLHHRRPHRLRRRLGRHAAPACARSAAARDTSSSTPRAAAARRPAAGRRSPAAAASPAPSAMRSRVAKPMPTRIARDFCLGASPATAMPTTMALSPASTRSISMTWTKATSCGHRLGSSAQPCHRRVGGVTAHRTVNARRAAHGSPLCPPGDDRDLGAREPVPHLVRDRGAGGRGDGAARADPGRGRPHHPRARRRQGRRRSRRPTSTASTRSSARPGTT